MAIAHAVELEAARTAITAGADGLAHVFEDVPADDAFLRLMRRSGAFATSVLTTADCGEEARILQGDPQVRPFLARRQRAALTNATSEEDCSTATLDVALGNVRRFSEAGIPITAGTDAGVRSVAHGASVLTELGLLVRGGFSPAQALAAATTTPARAYGLRDRGRIAGGRRADLLLVDGNPARDIAAIRDVDLIWKNGYVVDRRPSPQPVARSRA